MAKKLLASVMAFALCLFVSAADMVVKGKNGEDRKINVVDQSKTFLEFKVLSDSTVKVTNKYPSYRGHKSITIPEKVRIEGKVYTVTSIGEYAFEDCSSFTSIKIPKGVTNIGEWAFYKCSSLTSIKIPEGVTSIGEYAFDGCKSLTSIKIPEGVTSIGESAFEGCSSLASINIPEGVTSIEVRAFYGCSSLTSIKIPEGVTSIGYKAFYGCSYLEIVIDNSKENVKVGDFAFDGCKSVKWLKD